VPCCRGIDSLPTTSSVSSSDSDWDTSSPSGSSSSRHLYHLLPLYLALTMEITDMMSLGRSSFGTTSTPLSTVIFALRGEKTNLSRWNSNWQSLSLCLATIPQTSPLRTRWSILHRPALLKLIPDPMAVMQRCFGYLDCRLLQCLWSLTASLCLFEQFLAQMQFFFSSEEEAEMRLLAEK